MRPASLGRRATYAALGMVALAACGSEESASGTSTPMGRCDNAQVETVADHPNDTKRLSRRSLPEEAATVAANPAAFDITRVRVAATHSTLCASVTFAKGTRRTRDVFLFFSEVPPVRNGDTPLARLEFGNDRNSAGLAGRGVPDVEPEAFPIKNVTTSPVQGRTVRIAVPIRWLGPALVNAPGDRSARLDPKSFAWRLVVASDCLPGPRSLTAYPSGRTIPFPNGAAFATDFCR